MPPPSKHKASEPKRALKVKEKAEEAAKMRGASEQVYSGPTLPPLTPGERAEVEADMASAPIQLIFVLVLDQLLKFRNME